MRLLLVRHGDPDYPRDCLTPKGEAQVRRLARALAAERIERIYASPMGRAKQTAAAVAAVKELPVEILPWLHELNGNYTGSLWAWNYPGCAALAEATTFTSENWATKVPYGEHMIPVAGEFWANYDEFLAGHGLHREGQRYRLSGVKDVSLACFCHAGVILTLLAHLLHLPLPLCYAQLACDPSSVTELRLETEGDWGVFRLQRLNDMSHAAELGSVVAQTGQFAPAK